MTRKTAHDYDQELLILFDAYVHGGIDRRTFLDKAAKFAVGGVTAAMLLDELNPKFLEAQVVSLQDSRIRQEYIEFDSPNGYGRARGYFVTPASATGPLPAAMWPIEIIPPKNERTTAVARCSWHSRIVPLRHRAPTASIRRYTTVSSSSGALSATIAFDSACSSASASSRSTASRQAVRWVSVA